MYFLAAALAATDLGVFKDAGRIAGGAFELDEDSALRCPFCAFGLFSGLPLFVPSFASSFGHLTGDCHFIDDLRD